MANSPRKRRGLPAANTVVAEIAFIPGGRRALIAPGAAPAYRILRTTQVDPYDRPVSRRAIAAARAPAAVAGDSFRGTSRKAAKLSIVPGKA